MEKKFIKLTENELQTLINESIEEVLNNEDYVKYPKYNTPYDDNKEGNGVTQPLKNETSLYDVRARISNILIALRNDKKEDAKKQLLRLYKMVDAMINQGY
jgi:hypothetical protein